jgi:adenine C2-methylase RlmN of 23S rRNA A2503 and tRNA A37
MTDQRLFRLSPNQVTLSTVGVTHRIYQLTKVRPCLHRPHSRARWLGSG